MTMTTEISILCFRNIIEETFSAWQHNIQTNYQKSMVTGGYLIRGKNCKFSVIVLIVCETIIDSRYIKVIFYSNISGKARPHRKL